MKLRDEKHQLMLRYHGSRLLLMETRTSMIAQTRCFAKSMGFRLPECSAERFHKLDRSSWPSEFERMAWPMMDMAETVNLKIAAYDSMIAMLAEEPEFKEQVRRAREAYGVGVVASTVIIVANDGDPGRFKHARDIGQEYLAMRKSSKKTGA